MSRIGRGSRRRKHGGRRRRGVLAAAVGLVLTLGACAGGPQLDGGDGERALAAAPSEPVAPEDVARPAVDGAAMLEELTGEALARARQSLEAVLAETSPPDYLVEAGEAGAETEDAEATGGEPPLEAQRAYAAGRMAWHAQNTYEAINHLERALRVAPDEPAILRLLGEIQGEAGNRVRAAMHFKEAVRLDPTHAPTLVQLGRFALEQERDDEAIHVLHRALTLVRERGTTDRTLRPLLHYYLAGALRRAGYAAAALEQHRQYRATLPEEGISYTPGVRELMVLERQARLSWQLVGDLHHQLGEPDRALQAYRRALALSEQREDAVEAALLGRLLYTHLRLGDAVAARELAIEHLRRREVDEDTLALVRYLTSQGAGGAALAESLRELYAQEDRPGSLALALADLLVPDDGRALLREHLEARPGDTRVFEGLLVRLMPGGASATEMPRVVESVTVTSEVMAGAPGEAETRAQQLFEAAGGAGALLDAFAALPEDVRARPMARVLRGLALMAAGRVGEAGEPLAAALADEPELEVARLALARVAMRHGDDERADELLAPLAERGEPEIVRLRVRVLARRGQVDAALALLEEQMRRHGADVEWLLQKAELQLRAGQPSVAERTLLDALNAHPEDERIYAALLELYDPAEGEPPAIDDAQTQYQRLVRRLLGTIPDSRLGRLVRANLMAARREHAEAERLLKTMLDEDPLDLEVLGELLRLYLGTNEVEKGAELLEDTIEAHPHRHELLVLAMGFYRRAEDMEGARGVGERLLALEPTDFEPVQALASLFLWAERPDRAVAAVEQALAAEVVHRPTALASLLGRAMRRAGQGEAAVDRLDQLAVRFDEHEADIRCELALLLDELGDAARAEQVLIETLERHPDHPRTNNALGYTWVDQDQHLERAKAMIEKAVEAEPDSAAYLDSLGWAYYKLGDFESAIDWLERSRDASGASHPVILDHLGDAYYRLGEHDQARNHWQRAARQMRFMDQPTQHRELEGLEERIQAKLQALDIDEPAPVATSPGAPEQAEQAEDAEGGDEDG